MDYRDARVLVTGGLGFVGSNLATRLVEHGAHVTLVDSKRRLLAIAEGDGFKLKIRRVFAKEA